MSRVYFPTYSLNRFGVRVASQRATLGAIQRFDNEPTPRAAMTPTGPMLGAIIDGPLNSGSELVRVPISRGGPIFWSGPLPGPAQTGNPPSPLLPVFSPGQLPPPQLPPASSGGGGAVSA